MRPSCKPILMFFTDTSNAYDNRPRLKVTIDIRGWDSDGLRSADYLDPGMPRDMKSMSLDAFGHEFSDGKRSDFHWTQMFERMESRDIQSAALASKKIERKMDKLSKDLGRPQNFHTYVAYLAKSLGIKSFVRRHPNNDTLQELPIASLISILSDLERNWLASEKDSKALQA